MDVNLLQALDEVVNDLKKLSDEALVEKLKAQAYGPVSYAVFDASEFVVSVIEEFLGCYKKVDKSEIEKELLNKLYSEFEFIERLGVLSDAANDDNYLMAA